MPNDIEDMMTDFGMMLDGITLDRANGLNERVKCRLACYWVWIMQTVDTPATLNIQAA